MDQVIKRSQNTGQQQSAPATAATSPSSSRSKHAVKAIILVIVIALILGGGYFLKTQLMGNNFAQAVNKDRYQAVFLTNGQVYFGKIDKITANSYVLKDIYYLQVQQDVQGEKAQTDENNDQNLSLAKLGSELHGPDDVMYIEGKQVLFWENLKDDGQVVKAINANKKQ